MNHKLTRGVHHIGLTVPDLDQARAFFCGVLGFDEVGGVPSYPAIFVSDGAVLLTLWRAEDPLTARARPADPETRRPRRDRRHSTTSRRERPFSGWRR